MIEYIKIEEMVCLVSGIDYDMYRRQSEKVD